MDTLTLLGLSLFVSGAAFMYFLCKLLWACRWRKIMPNAAPEDRG